MSKILIGNNKIAMRDGKVCYARSESELTDLSATKLNDIIALGKYQVESETPWAINWEIVDIQGDYQIAQTNKIIDLRCFDAKETGRSSSSYQRDGWNKWDVSNVKQWLNSSAEVWYSKQHNYDMPPNTDTATYTPYETHKGFLYYFSDIEKQYLQDMTITLKSGTNSSATYQWAGKVWLPTYTQIFGGQNKGVDEGAQFQVYANGGSKVGQLHKMCAENSNYRNTTEIAENQNWRYWTCSVGTSTDTAVRSVETNGGVANLAAAAGFVGIRPCIKLPRSGYLPMN